MPRRQAAGGAAPPRGLQRVILPRPVERAQRVGAALGRPCGGLGAALGRALRHAISRRRPPRLAALTPGHRAAPRNFSSPQKSAQVNRKAAAPADIRSSSIRRIDDSELLRIDDSELRTKSCVRIRGGAAKARATRSKQPFVEQWHPHLHLAIWRARAFREGLIHNGSGELPRSMARHHGHDPAPTRRPSPQTCQPVQDPTSSPEGDSPRKGLFDNRLEDHERLPRLTQGSGLP